MAPAILALLQFAPHLMKFFNAGEAPTKIVETISDVAKTVSGAPTLEDAVEVLKGNAEKAYEFKTKMLEVDAELEAAYLADRQSARLRDVELAKAGHRNVRADILAYGALTVCGIAVLLIFFGKVPEGSAKEILIYLLGLFSAIVKDVYSFEFGTSRQSKEKDFVISALSTKAQ